MRIVRSKISFCAAAATLLTLCSLNAYTFEQIFEASELSTSNLIFSNHSFLDLGLQQVFAAELATDINLLNWRNTPQELPLPPEPYNRKLQFGRWINDPNDETCFNTRAKVLVRDSERDVQFKDSNKCVVMAGQWSDPYTGQKIEKASEVQIDHMVPLKNAFLSGAWKWGFKARCLYANYMGENFHLIPVNGIQNMTKGDRGPDAYIPPNENYTCTYLRHWLSIKLIWKLKMRDAEAVGIREALKEAQCRPEDFVFSDQELKQQRKFIVQNADLCDHLGNNTQ